MICFHFMLFEQELIIALFILFAFNSRLPYYIIILLFIILLFDTLIAINITLLKTCISFAVLFLILQLKEFLYSFFSLSDCIIGSIS